MKFTTKLFLPVLAIGLCGQSAFAMQQKNDRVKNDASQTIQKSASTNPDTYLLKATAVTIAASQACLGLATLGKEDSILRDGMNALGLYISAVYYLNWYHTEHVNPLVSFLCAAVVLPSSAYTWGTLNSPSKS